jgi:hypothetical protein
MFGREQSGHHRAGLPPMRTTVQLERLDLQLRGQSGRIGASRAAGLSSALLQWRHGFRPLGG